MFHSIQILITASAQICLQLYLIEQDGTALSEYLMSSNLIYPVFSKETTLFEEVFFSF